jgi:hypothetical protein
MITSLGKALCGAGQVMKFSALIITYYYFFNKQIPDTYSYAVGELNSCFAYTLAQQGSSRSNLATSSEATSRARWSQHAIGCLYKIGWKKEPLFEQRISPHSVKVSP